MTKPLGARKRNGAPVDGSVPVATGQPAAPAAAASTTAATSDATAVAVAQRRKRRPRFVF